MRKFLYLSGLFIVIALTIWQCAQNSTNPERTPPRALSSAELRLVDSDNTFGFKLFKQIVADQPDSNIFISPLSVAMALGMTYNGAEGTTREAMDSVLELNGMDIQAVNESYQSLIDLLVNLDPEVTFQIANSIWYRDNFPVLQDFIELNQTYFYAEVDALDFDDPTAADIINDWVYDNTNGKIESIVNGPINPMVVMYLINAIYFNGDWTYQFDPDQTEEDTFYLPDSTEFLCQMMAMEANCRYMSNDLFRAVDLPYGYDLYSMTILLPHESVDPETIFNELNQANWVDWIEELSPRDIVLRFPKFKLEYDCSLVDHLTNLGMGIAFTPYLADFGGMTDEMPGNSLFISDAKHKTFIEVDEEGTEAAAVTSAEMNTTSVPEEPGPIFIDVDHPFIFIIRENHSGTILFIGKIIRPDWE